MTARLFGSARAQWAAFDGWAAATMGGTDPLDLPFDRFLNLIYHWLTNGADPAEIKKFDARLWRPLPGMVPAAGSPWSAEAETAAFKAFSAEFSGTVGTPREGSTLPGSAPGRTA